jgi:putative spermidine/putrescine transport system ATP-binding protein
MAQVSISALTKRYGGIAAVDDLNLTIPHGEMLALLGPSGCGKTTTLRMIAGFIEPSSGSIALDGGEITHVPAHKRNLGLVFQSYALFPHMTAAENIAFGLKMRGLRGSAVEEKVRRALAMVRLETLGGRFPRELSGGQQQRVALARALVIEPRMLLLDEPLSNLDASLREEVRSEIRAVQRDLGLTTLFVTHDQEEALSVADRVGVMRNGRLEQLAPAADIYGRPSTRFVATFLGKANVIEGAVNGDRMLRHASGISIPHAGPDAADLIAVRPERIVLNGTGLDFEIEARVADVTFLGASSEVVLDTPVGRLTARVADPPQPNTSARAGWRATDCVPIKA